MSEIKYRGYRSGDRDSVLSLFEASFGKKRDSTQWDWEFTGGPQPAVIVVAESSQRLVGHYAILPRRVKVGSSLVDSGLVVDVMTHPEFGRRGIFVNSGLEAFGQAEEKGLRMLIGFPNEAAIRGHLKVGWKELGSVRVLARPLKGSVVTKAAGDRVGLPRFAAKLIGVFLDAVNRISLGSPPPDSHMEWTSADSLDRVGKEYDLLAKKFTESISVCNTRELEWMKWRLSDPLDATHVLLIRDEASMELKGVGVLKVKDKDGIRTGAVMDLMAKDNDKSVLSILIRETLRKAIEADCELLVLLRSPALHHGRALARMLLIPTPRSLRFIVRPIQDEGIPEEAYDLDNWHLELIDHDVF